MAELNDILSDDSIRCAEQLRPVIRKNYGIDFEGLIKEPMNYADSPKIAEKIKSMEKDVDKFVDDRIAAMPEEKKALDNDLAVIDGDSKKIAQAITTKASIAQVPYVKPLFVDSADREEILVEGYDASIDQLVTRMINISDYIADMSTEYAGYVIGSWLFSGRRKYVISISPPASEIMAMDRAREEIKGLLEEISSEINAK